MRRVVTCNAFLLCKLVYRISLYVLMTRVSLPSFSKEVNKVSHNVPQQPSFPLFPNQAQVQQGSPEAIKNAQEWMNQQAEIQRRKEEAEAVMRRQAAYKSQQQSSQRW